MPQLLKGDRIVHINIFDTTLRDYEQTPGVVLTTEEKIQIAEQLDKMGVDVIEVGTPINSKDEKKAAIAIGKLGLKSKTWGEWRNQYFSEDYCNYKERAGNRYIGRGVESDITNAVVASIVNTLNSMHKNINKSRR